MNKSLFTKIIAMALVVISLMSISIPAFAVSSCTTNTTGVNLRKSATSTSTRLGTLSMGTSVDVLCTAEGYSIESSNSTEWYYVKVRSGSYSGTYGYIHSSLVDGFDYNDIDHPDNELEAFGSNLLQNGSKGSAVRNVQYVLFLEGYLTERQIDGAFGSQTRSALIEYQEDHFGYGAEDEPNAVDGIAGDQTKGQMWADHHEDLEQFGYRY